MAKSDEKVVITADSCMNKTQWDGWNMFAENYDECTLLKLDQVDVPFLMLWTVNDGRYSEYKCSDASKDELSNASEKWT